MNPQPEPQEFCSSAFIEDVVSRAKEVRAVREQATRDATDRLTELASALCGKPVKVWAKANSDKIMFELVYVGTGGTLCLLAYPWPPNGRVGDIYPHAANRIAAADLDKNPILVTPKRESEEVKA
jgi:hypothetical protein